MNNLFTNYSILLKIIWIKTFIVGPIQKVLCMSYIQWEKIQQWTYNNRPHSEWPVNTLHSKLHTTGHNKELKTS